MKIKVRMSLTEHFSYDVDAEAENAQAAMAEARKRWNRDEYLDDVFDCLDDSDFRIYYPETGVVVGMSFQEDA